MEFLDDVPLDAGGDDASVGDGMGSDAGGNVGVAEMGDSGLPGAVADEPDVDGIDKPESEGTEEGVSKIDGRTAADAVKKGLAKLRETDPKLADSVRKAYFKQEGEVRQFREAFNSPAEARAARELLETEGGAEVIAKNKEDADAYAQELLAFSEGRPEVIDNLARDYPEALPKLADYGLSKLKQTNPERYSLTMAKQMIPLLREKGVLSTLSSLAQVIADGGTNAQRDAMRLAKTLTDWFDGTDQYARSVPDRPQDDPRVKELDAREQKLNQETERVKSEQIGKAATTRINGVLTSAMAPFLKGKTLTTQQRAGIYTESFTNVSKALEGNKDYQTKLKSLIRRGNVQDIARFVESNVKQIAGRAVKEAWSSRGFAAPATRTAATSRPAAGTITVGQKPDSSLIDWSKDPGRSRFMGERDGGQTGEATLKDGTIRRWKW